jgi:hypothetical protein
VPSSRAAFDLWEGAVLSREGPIVWASTAYEKTGVEPYVSEQGARVPSLRRLSKKRPYFTNGSAKTVAEVLDRARWDGNSFFHDRAPAGALPLDDDEKTALAAFLDIL